VNLLDDEAAPNVQGKAQATPGPQLATVTMATAGKKPQATPAVRRIASEHNVRRNSLTFVIYCMP